MVNPLDSKAPMSTVPLTIAGSAALVGGDAGGNEGVVARVDGRAAGQQGHGLGRPAVVAQRGQQGVERRGDGAGQVGADPAGAAVGLADQVVAPGSRRRRRHRARGAPCSRRRSCCPAWSCRCCCTCRRRWLAELPLTVQLVSVAVPPVVEQAAAGVAGGVAADGAVGQREPCRRWSYRPPP